MTDKLKPFTEEEKMLAEKNHDLVYQFLREHDYSITIISSYSDI